MAAAAIETVTMALEFHESKEGSLFDAIFASTSTFSHLSPPSSGVDLQRAASYNDFTSVTHETQSDSTSNDGTRDSSSIDDNKTDDVWMDSSGDTTPESEAASSIEARKSKSPAENRRLNLPRIETAENPIQHGSNTEHAMTTPILRTPVSAEGDEVFELPTESSSRLSARFRRRSWMPSPRSLSPAGQKTAADGFVDTLGKASSVVRRSSPFRSRSSTDSEKDENHPISRSSSLSRNITNRLSKRPTSAIFEPAPKNLSSPVSKPSQLSKSFSTDKLSLSSFAKSKNTNIAPLMPRLSSKDKQRLVIPEATKKRDELWTAFRNLDADYQK
jgi:hypothetical protein